MQDEINLIQPQDNKFLSKIKESVLTKPFDQALSSYKNGKLEEAISKF
jgi:hypothetical protein